MAIDAKLGAAGFSDLSRERFQALHRDQRVCVLTAAGISLGALRGLAAVLQGGGFCPFLSLLAQDPAQRLLDAEMEWGGFLVRQTRGAAAALPRGRKRHRR